MAPLVLHGFGVGVHGDEGQLIEPAGDQALGIHKAHSLAGTHGDAQHAVGLETHGAGKGGNVAVVDNAIGDGAKGVGNGADINVLHLTVVQVFGNLQEQGGGHGAVVDEDTGGGDANRVHPGQVGSGGLQRGHDALIVIVRVGIGLGEPDHLFGIHGLAVDHGGDLPVAAAGVKADTAAGHMAADGLGGILALRQGIGQHYLKGVFKNAGHILPVKGLAAARRISLFQVGIDALVPTDIDPEAALHPEDGLDQAVDVIAIRLVHGRGAMDKGLHGSHLPVGPLHSDAHALLRAGEKGLVEAVQRNEAGVQLRNVADVNVDAKMFHSFRLL